MFRRFLLGGSTLFFGLLLCVPAFGQEHYLKQLYGQGVHAFNRGNYSESQRLLDEAINAGIDDPRAYYFRAFTKMRSGGSFSAESDIRAGAQLEVDGYNGYDIGMSLQRVQGTHRIAFEKIRSSSKLAAQRAKRNYRTQTTLGGGYGDGGSRAGGSGSRTAVPQGPDPGGLDPTDPFSGDEQPVPADPFTDDAQPAVAPEVDSNEDMPADDAGDDLFGGDDADADTPADAGDDLFGTDDAPADPAPADAGDDLFGGDDAPADLDPAPGGDAAPADAGGDLFGPEGGSDPAPGGDELDDLFG